jgi:hypothetical protein
MKLVFEDASGVCVLVLPRGSMWWVASSDLHLAARLGVEDACRLTGFTSLATGATRPYIKLVSDMAEPLGDVRVGRASKLVVEVGGGSKDFVQRGEDAVVGGGQLGQGVDRLVEYAWPRPADP